MPSFKLILGLLFVLLVAGISVLMLVVYERNKDSNNTAGWIQHTEEVLDNTDELSSLYKNIQLESLGIIYEGEPSLSIYRESKERVLNKLHDLRELTKDNTTQRVRIDTLTKILNQLTLFSDSIVNSPDSNTKSLTGIRNVIRKNSTFRGEIRKQIRLIKAEEMKLLQIHKNENAKSEQAFNNAFLLMVFSLGTLLIAIFFTVRNNFNKRMQIQGELRKANELFSKLFQESPVGIVISELETGIIIDCNKAYSKLIQLSKQEIIGKSGIALGIVKPDQRKKIKESASSQSYNYDIDMELYAKNGSIPFQASVSMQNIQIQNKTCLLSVVLDMTPHKKAEEDIKNALAKEVELNKMKSNFVTLASHEFRTPLTTILSSASLLENYSSGENQEKISKHLVRIKSSVNTLTSILDEFLSLNKIEEGKIKPVMEHLNIEECLDKTCKNLSAFAKLGQQIVYSHRGDHDVVTDPVILRNIVNNLVSNAIKYSPENSSIYVTSHVNKYLKLSVKDSGIGISEQDQKHLFTRFFRGSNAGTVQGTGLGLHIMKNYVQMLNGSIALKSELGKGSEFTVTFDASSVTAQ